MNATAPPPYSASVVGATTWHLPRYHVKQEACEPVGRHDDSGISPGRSASGSGSSDGPSPERETSAAAPYYQPPPPPPYYDVRQLDASPGHHQVQQQQQSEAAQQHSPAPQQQVTPPPPPPQQTTPPPPTAVQPKAEPASPGPVPGYSSPAAAQADDQLSNSSHSSAEGADALRRLQVAVDNMHLVNPGPGATYDCPVCTAKATTREELQAHLGTHYEHRCPVCEYVAPSADILRSHLREAHAMSPPQDDPTETKLTSQGRVKTFRCKQCNFVAVTKLSFWEHSRCHIRAERLLTCQRCPFVTEYKHHLEYHMRNHTGSKPFRCDKCSYQCVNKSMLNSHLKSHSNVYQYRCADCRYATKYCHSLKLHLRKYRHQPDTVLNPDGSPNPLPIIDVYGTRRGPKQKPRTSDESPSSMMKVPQQAGSGDIQGSPQQLGQQQTFQQSSLGPLVPQDVPALQQFQPSPYGPIARASAIPYAYNTLGMLPSVPAFPYNTVPREGSDMPGYDSYHGASAAACYPFYVNNNNNNENLQKYSDTAIKEYMTQLFAVAQLQMPKVPLQNDLSDPLDLSRSEAVVATADAETNQVPPASPDPTQTPDQPPCPSQEDHAGAVTQPTTKHRRKGKAYKLERIAMKLQYHADDDSAGEEPELKVAKVESPVLPTIPAAEVTNYDRPCSPDPEEDNGASNDGQVFRCTHCEITFRDVVMYSLHKGYHGHSDPFTCNSCGQQTADRIEFFLHIARSPHS